MTLRASDHATFGRQLDELLRVLQDMSAVRAVNLSFGISNVYSQLDELDNGVRDASFDLDRTAFGDFNGDGDHSDPSEFPGFDADGDGALESYRAVMDHFGDLYAGTLDAALVHRPGYYAGLMVEQLLEEKLLLVRAAGKPEPSLFIDWGPDFVAQYDATLPQPRHAALTFNLGPLALQYLLRVGGSGYFRTRVAQPHLDSGALEKVADAPEFTYPVYLVYRAGTAGLDSAIAGFRTLAEHTGDWHL